MAFSVQRSWGSVGPADGEFNSPAGLAISPKGDIIYVSDTKNNRIQFFDDEGNFLGKWGTLGNGFGQLKSPDGITTDTTGSFVYVADRNNDRIQIFGSSGDYIMELKSLGTLAGQFNKPRDVALDFSNRLYIVDKENNNVQVFTPTALTKELETTSAKSTGGGTETRTNEGVKSTDNGSPAQHRKSYFTEIFESESRPPAAYTPEDS